ncbi:hypothetical protein KAJ41_00380 [Candidatus Parcubacteria bacterium]|nr:hypothetical protein [Candidatus Parcubacteria bacterium]
MRKDDFCIRGNPVSPVIMGLADVVFVFITKVRVGKVVLAPLSSGFFISKIPKQSRWHHGITSRPCIHNYFYVFKDEEFFYFSKIQITLEEKKMNTVKNLNLICLHCGNKLEIIETKSKEPSTSKTYTKYCEYCNE